MPNEIYTVIVLFTFKEKDPEKLNVIQDLLVRSFSYETKLEANIAANFIHYSAKQLKDIRIIAIRLEESTQTPANFIQDLTTTLN